MSEIRKCTVGELFSDTRCAELIDEYAAECGIALVGKPAPRRDIYENLEASGLGQCFAAYEQGELVGFAMLVTSVVPHYGLACATPESIFVKRGSHSGTALMRALEEYAMERGCRAIFYTAPANSRMARLLFLCADEYRNTNHVFAKRLN